ncbi:uncharacterized protein LOC126766873 [Bactrocera neohumeralis]|uniref:uncharacterized protein LOC126766873 n=1 Tax=Bactrocera neohumeralis TaxID=98809 RepID=UPI0021668DAA|nr:uncharacterized protein LOC126766873 [Bactrocera neohumeralis]
MSRWDILKQYVEITVKRHCETKWSSEAQAVKPVSTQLDEVISALEQLRDSVAENIDTRQDAALVINAIETFSFVALFFFWAEILESFDKVQRKLQEKGMTFTHVLGQLQILVDKLNDWRTSLCDQTIVKAKNKCEQWGVTIIKRIRKKRNMHGEISEDAGLNSKEEMRRCMIEILDKLSMEISTRFTNLEKLNDRFGFLCDFERIIELTKDSYNDKLVEIKEKCQQLAESYPDDLDNEDLYRDIQDVLLLLKRAQKNEEQIGFSPEKVLLYISSMGLEAYKTLATAVRILLTIPVSVASCERFFSKLKLIKSYLRSTMSQRRLSNPILSIECETASTLNYNDMICDFAAIKARKVHI